MVLWCVSLCAVSPLSPAPYGRRFGREARCTSLDAYWDGRGPWSRLVRLGKGGESFARPLLSCSVACMLRWVQRKSGEIRHTADVRRLCG